MQITAIVVGDIVSGVDDCEFERFTVEVCVEVLWQDGPIELEKCLV